MEIKDIALVVLVLIVALLVGFLFGRKKNSNILSDKVISPTHPTPDTEIHKKDTVLSRVKDYSREILKVQEYHQRAALIYSVIAEHSTYSPFNDAYGKVDKAYEEFDPGKKDHTSEHFHKLFSSIFDAVKFDSAQRELAASARENAKQIIDYYEKQISTIFSGQPFENLSSKYRLNPDLREAQLGKISAILTNNFSIIFAEITDIEQRKLWLQANYQAFIAASDDKFEWGSAAMGFGKGALAAVHPLIGIPLLIKHFSTESETSRAKSALIDMYTERFDEFENKIQSLRQQILHVGDNIKGYIAEKFKEINVSAISTVLSETAASGCNLDHYFKSLDFKELEETERGLLIKGA